MTAVPLPQQPLLAGESSVRYVPTLPLVVRHGLGDKYVRIRILERTLRGLPHPAYDHMSAKESIAKRNGSQARDPIKGVKVKYPLAVTKEPLLKRNCRDGRI